MYNEASIFEALKASKNLELSESPQLDCQLILGHCLGQSRTWLLSHDEHILSTKEINAFNAAMEKRRGGLPLAYILGKQDFWSLSFKVNEASLIPRPETELIVETILDRYPNDEITIIDLGTGAGPIAISIASERSRFDIYATDMSFEALRLAKENSSQITNAVTFIQCNWLNAFDDKRFDIIISNPPYIEAENEHLCALKYEPIAALVAEDCGLSDIKLIISSAKNKLKPGGMVIVEHGFDQQLSVKNILLDNGFTGVELLQDLAGRDRVALAIMK
ncbi:MAG: release factor glutamine methyltransferase [Candidatus Azotimanducaceae bacterium]|jgi:release factor glutamine methyltransferase